MPFRQPAWNQRRAEILMDLSAILADCTQSTRQLDQIPDYLSRVLELESITLALVRHGEPNDEVILCATSGTVVRAAPEFTAELLELARQSNPAPGVDRDNSAVRPRAIHTTTLDVHQFVGFPRAAVFACDVDRGFCMMLLVHQRAADGPLPAGLTESLHAITLLLAKFLDCLVIWLFRPQVVGTPFNLLTQREWMVLRSLTSDASEKQLADQLNLSPHTLHSHIKAIYRKLAVTGRLSLFLRIQDKMRDLRLARLEQKNGHSTIGVSTELLPRLAEPILRTACGAQRFVNATLIGQIAHLISQSKTRT